MDVRTLVAGESDVSNLASLLGLQGSFHAAAGAKDAVRISHANHFMKLPEVEVIGLQPLQRFIELLGGRLFGLAVNLGHKECFLPISVAQRLSHANLALTFVVIPTVIEEVDAVVECSAHNA